MVKGDSVELGVTVNVPGGRQCELINRAATIFPVAGTRYNNIIGDDLAAATSRIPAKSCEKPDRPQCEPGTNELRSSSGACVCKTGYMRDDSHACVRIIAEPQLCPDGKPVPRNGRCPSVTPKCEPGPGEYRNDDGQCVCKRGLERNTRGRCVEKPTPQCEPGRNEYRDDDGHCVCKRGFERNENGRCVEKTTPAVRAGRTSIATTTANACASAASSATTTAAASRRRPRVRARPNEYRDDDGKCVCKRGFERDGKGAASRRRPAVRPAERVPQRRRQCVCKRGFERDDKAAASRRPCDPADDYRTQGQLRGKAV